MQSDDDQETNRTGNQLPRAHREHWGARLVMARRARGWSQSQLGRTSGRRQQTISKIEAGQNGIGDPLKVDLARALGVSPDVLFPLTPPGQWPALPSLIPGSDGRCEERSR